MARTPRKERISRWDYDTVCRHIRKKHPSCPEFAVQYFANEVSGREWKASTLNMTVAIVMQTTLRHRMTEYETLLLHGVARAAAMRRVQPEIKAMLAVWRKRPEASEQTTEGSAKVSN